MSRLRARAVDLSTGEVNPGRLEAGLQPPLAGPLEWHREVGSTNDVLSDRARGGAVEGTIVCADHQTTGRGRLGREWQDVPGRTLAISVLLRPPVWVAGDAGALPILVATAVAEGIGFEAKVAWPNDVILDGRKVSGILLEAAWEGPSLAWVVAGIGVNVRGVPDVPAGTWPPGALDDRGADPSRELVAGAILAALGRQYETFCRQGPEPVMRAFAARDALAGRVVRVRNGDDVRDGSADGIDADGALRLRTAAGVEIVSSADRLELLEPRG